MSPMTWCYVGINPGGLVTISRRSNILSYNEIRLVPGKERHRSVAELAQARKGMRHRDG